MSTAPRVVAICGSLRDGSYTRSALEHALSSASAHGASTHLLDLRDYDLPVFDPDDRDAGDASRLREKLDEADAIILGSPMYHGSYSAPLKNALDYSGFDEFEHKTVGLLTVSGGQFPSSTLEHLRSVCRSLNAWVLPHQVAIPNVRTQFSDGSFVDDSLADRVAVLGRRTVEFSRIEPDPDSFESEQNVGADD